MFLKMMILSTILIAFGLVALGIRILIQKGGKFPNSSVSANPTLRKMGIQCARCEELKAYRKLQKKHPIKINPNKLKITITDISSSV
jgi:hypothetical protein